MTIKPEPVPATRKDTTVDVLHGVAVPDPYRWLENGKDPEVLAWTRAQNDRSAKLLESLPGHTLIETRLTELLQVGQTVDGKIAGGKVFTLRRERGRQQAVLFVRKGVDSEDHVLFDPEREDARGLLSLDWWYPSLDGSLVAYGASEAGKEWSDLRVRDAASGRDLDDCIPRARSASVAWLPDASGFFYTRYPLPCAVPVDEENYWRRVYRHQLGTAWENDELVWGEGRPMTELPWLTLDRGGRWLVVDANEGWSKTDIGDDDRPVLLRTDEDAGHGAGKPRTMRVREAADTWSFFGWQLGIDWEG